MEGYKTFINNKAWKLGREFKKKIYNITEKFPEEERYCLSQQIKRSAISITANIAEGYGRYTFQENINFCRISRGSLNETLDHLCTAFDAKYISKEIFANLYNEGKIVEKAINGYIGFLKNSRAKQL